MKANKNYKKVLICQLSNPSRWYLYDYVNKCPACNDMFDSKYAAEKYCKKHDWIIVQ